MKRNLLLAAMLAVTFNAHATGNEGNGCIGNCPSTTDGGTTTSSAVAGAMALSGAAAFGGGGYARSGDSNANNSVSVDNGNDRIIPVSSAIAPSVMQNSICPIISPSSKAASILIFSASGTTGTTLNAICVAWNLKQLDVVERMACNADKAYAKANPACEVK